MTEEQSIELFREVNKLNPSPIVELYEIDATDIGGDQLFFHNGTNGVQYDPVHFNGQAYMPRAIAVTGFMQGGNGEPPRPRMTISNAGGWLSSIVMETKDLVGARVIRRRTFAKYLDGMPDAKPIEFDPDIFFIEQKIRENRILVEFELGTGYDLDGVMLPARQVSSFCSHVNYRGEGCGFSGRYCVTDSKNQPHPNMLTYYRQPWSNSTIYPEGVVVHFITEDEEFGLYKALQDAQGISQSPTNTDYWERIQRDCGEYDEEAAYEVNDVLYIERNSIKYYYLVRKAVPAGIAPPNSVYYVPDICSKTLQACKYRFDPRSSGSRALPFGGFPGVLNLPEV